MTQPQPLRRAADIEAAKIILNYTFNTDQWQAEQIAALIAAAMQPERDAAAQMRQAVERIGNDNGYKFGNYKFSNDADVMSVHSDDDEMLVTYGSMRELEKALTAYRVATQAKSPPGTKETE